MINRLKYLCYLASFLVFFVPLYFGFSSFALADYTISGTADTFQVAYFDTSNPNYNFQGQQFTTLGAGVLTTPSVELQATASLTGTITLYLEADSGGYPAGAILDSCTFSATTVTTSVGFYSCSFSSGYSLSAGTPYWIVVGYPTATAHLATIGSYNTSNLGPMTHGASYSSLGGYVPTSETDISLPIVTSGGGGMATSSSDFVFLQQGILSSESGYLTSGVQTYEADMGRGFVGSTTGAFVAMSWHQFNTADDIIDLHLYGYTDSNYTTASTTADFSSAGIAVGSYSATSSNPFTQLSVVGGSDLVLSPSLYYRVQLDVFTGISSGNQFNVDVFGDASSSLYYAGFPVGFVPQFAIVGTGFKIYDSNTIAINGFGGQIATACDAFLSSFDFPTCVKVLVVPSPSDFALVYNEDILPVFNKMPWGYVVRLGVLLDGEATSSPQFNGGVLQLPFGTTSALTPNLPALNVNLADTGIPITSGVQSVDLTPWNRLMGSTSLLGTATDTQGLTFRQVVEPGWDFLVVLLFGVGAILQLLGLNVAGGVDNAVRNERIHSRK